VLAALLIPGSAQRAEAGLAAVWAVDDGEKIFRDDVASPLKSGNSAWDGSNVSLFGARNEIVAFQLILEADGSGASNVDVVVSDLANGGNTITGSHPLPAANDYVGVGVELFTEHYLDVSVLSGDPGGGYLNWSASAAPALSGMTTGWMPDALVPFSAAAGKGGAPFSIAASVNQGVWVDIYIPRTAAVGIYSGSITITVGGATVATIPLQLEVLDVTLPDQTHYPSMVFISRENVAARHNTGYGTTAMWDILLEYNRMAHRHRLDLFGSGDWEEIDHLGDVLTGDAYTSAQDYEGPGEGVGNQVFSIATYGGWWWQDQSYFESESNAWVNWFGANAPNVDHFLYLVDEPGSGLYDDVKTRCDWIHNNPGTGSQLPVLVTTSVKDPLVGYVDIWSSPTMQWEGATTAQAEARGEQVHAYAAYRPKSGADVIDDWGIAYRVKPWIGHKWDITRWFTWESTHYSRNSNEINPGSAINVWVDPLTFHMTDASSTGNGDGILFYPGRDYVFTAQDRQYNGPISSLRMKMYRRGIQDTEYMWLVEQAGKSQQVQNLLQDLLPHTMDTAVTVPDWSNANAPYEEARRDLADLAAGTVRAPSARFQADTTRGAVSLTVNFSDLSILEPTAWSWTFGDGASSTSQHPSHTYFSEGAYTVALTASNAQGQDTEVKTNYINVVQQAVVEVDTWTTHIGWAEVSVVSGGVDALRYDDGVYMVMQPDNPERRYSALYTADSSYTPSQISRITIEYQAKRSSSATPSFGLVFARKQDGSWQSLGNWTMGLSDSDWTWETTDVSEYMNSAGVVGFEFCACPNGTANYTISSDVMRFRLELAGDPLAPVAEFAASPTSGTVPLTVNFTDASSNTPTSWLWTFGDGDTSTEQSPSHVYNSAGDYTVSLTATNGAGQDTETKVDYISAQPGAPSVLLEVHPDERAPGPGSIPMIGTVPWQASMTGPGGVYEWKKYQFEASGDLWVQVSGQAWSAAQNYPVGADKIRVDFDGVKLTDWWGIQSGPAGGPQWDGNVDRGKRLLLEFLVPGVSAGLHTLKINADETPVLWWVKVVNLAP